MEMTKGEICRMYRQASDKGAQIQILADLNCVRRTEIIRTLLDGGEKVRVHLPGRGKRRKRELTEKEYLDAAFKRLDELEARMLEAEREYLEIAEIIKAWK